IAHRSHCSAWGDAPNQVRGWVLNQDTSPAIGLRLCRVAAVSGWPIGRLLEPAENHLAGMPGLGKTQVGGGAPATAVP
ncbi:MAG: hypothetical protein Q6K81_07740, partial [Gloeomargarita sp. DG02_5_bins_242]